jgi:hypothetical protein
MRSRHRSQKSRWRKKDAVEKALSRIKGKDCNFSNLLIVSRNVIEALKLYRKDSFNEAMSEIIEIVSRLIDEHQTNITFFNKNCKFKIAKVRSRFSIKLMTRQSPKGTGPYFLAVVKVDESYVGYRIEDLADAIASSIVDDILSEN